MSGTNPENHLTPGEIESLERLEAKAQHGLDTYLGVRNALGEIRDRQLYRATHSTFEDYLHDRWGIDNHDGDLVSPAVVDAGVSSTSTRRRHQPPPAQSKPCEELAKVCEQTLTALRRDEPVEVEIRLVVRKKRDSGGLVGRSPLRASSLTELAGDELVPRLRWLLTQAGGTIADVAHQLETRGADIDNGARTKLRDDVLALEEELAAIEALLGEPVDWDSEFARLLKDEIPPLDDDDGGDPADE